MSAKKCHEKGGEKSDSYDQQPHIVTHMIVGSENIKDLFSAIDNNGNILHLKRLKMNSRYYEQDYGRVSKRCSGKFF